MYGGEEPYYAGIDIEESLEKGIPLDDLKCEFQSLLQDKLGMTVDISMIALHYGEVGT